MRIERKSGAPAKRSGMNQEPASLPPRTLSLRDAADVRSYPLLERDEVAVWAFAIAAPPENLDWMLAELTPDERTRADRYRADSAHRQFVVARSFLRRILGARLGLPPPEVPIDHAGAGKPVLAGGGIHFNVTHTDGLGLIALAHRPVGIDVERVRPIANSEGLVSRFFSPRERAEFLSLGDDLRPAGFFRGWTCKEAIIKASGLSVAYLDAFDVELHPARPASLLAARHPTIAVTEWVLAAWTPAPGYAAAVAIEGAGELRLEKA
jgi:4'-phosphopantetheinyl transferase